MASKKSLYRAVDHFYGWELAIAGLSALVLYRKLINPREYHTSLLAKPTPLASIRVLIPLSTLGVLALFISLNLLLSPYFQIANINTISGHALIFAFTWITANCIGICLSHLLSERIAQLNEKITSAKTLNDIGDMNGNLVELNPVISSLNQLKTQLSASIEENSNMRSALAASSAAAEVAHNIGSPLSSLEMGIKLIPSIPDRAAGIIKQALDEMRGIVHGFSDSESKREIIAVTSDITSQRKLPVASEAIVTLLEGNIAQKQLEYKERANIEIRLESDSSFRSLFSNINRVEFSIVISNLINNAVEAIPSDRQGTIRVVLSKEHDHAIIRIIDNGKGIAPENVSALGSPGVSIGKPKGTGYGLFHAKTRFQHWNGSLAISSIQNQGTELILKLPLIEPPRWFVSHVEIPKNGLVCLIDDDASIHTAWSARVESLGINESSLLHFYEPASFKTWYLESQNRYKDRSITYIVDYKFKGTEETGIDLIETVGISESSMLVTGHAAEPTVSQRCQWLGIKLIAKADVSSLPISFQTSRERNMTKTLELEKVALDTINSRANSKYQSEFEIHSSL